MAEMADRLALVAMAAQAEPAEPPRNGAGAAHTVLLSVAYDGRPYCGFAVQTGQPTVAGTLLQAIRQIDSTVDRLCVASRTDAGVHARVNLTAFDTAHHMPPRGWVLGLMKKLPDTVAVRAAMRMPRGFNPRFVMRQKRYRYLVLCDRLNDPLLAGRAWRVHNFGGDENLECMRRELGAALGEHDFSAFASARDKRTHTVRTLGAVSVTRLQSEPELLAIDICGDGFLHNMVRILVGSAVDVARGRLSEGAIASAIASGRRRDAGVTAPPEGLYLQKLWLLPTVELGDCWPPAGLAHESGLALVLGAADSG